MQRREAYPSRPLSVELLISPPKGAVCIHVTTTDVIMYIRMHGKAWLAVQELKEECREGVLWPS